MNTEGLFKIAMSGEVGRELLRKLSYDNESNKQTQTTVAKEDKMLADYKPEPPEVKKPEKGIINKPFDYNMGVPASNYKEPVNLKAPNLAPSPLFAAAPPAGNSWLSGLGSPTQEA